MDAITIDIGKILIEGVETVQDFRITYKQLGNKLNPPRMARTMDNNLYFLSDMCKELGLPLISVVVVNSETLMPGLGFFKYFFGVKDEIKAIEIFIEEYKKVLACKDWTSLRHKLA